MSETPPAVYLSYRRNVSYYLTLALFHALRTQGCAVFMDASGDTPHLGEIEARPHFCVVLTPSLSEAYQRADDTPRLEIEHAAQTRRAIVPLHSNGFSFSASFVPGEISFLRRYYSLTLTPETVAPTAAALREAFRTRAVFGQITPSPDPAAAEQIIAEATARPVPSEVELRSEVIFNRSFTRARQDYEGKLTDYDEALRLNPQYVHVRFYRGVARRRSGDEPGALADYDEAIRLDPRYTKAYNNRAELHFAYGDYPRALGDYEQATALAPAYIMALTGKALTLHALGQTDEAIRLWKSLLERDPRFHDPAWVGRELRLLQPLIDEAERLTQRLSAYAPDH